MRRWIGGFLLAVLAACLFGCSASGPRFSEMAGSLPSLGENEGRIYFYRNSILGAAVQPEVTVNGQIVGKSQPGSFFFIDRPTGTYRASARTEAEGAIDIVLRPRQTAYVQMSISMGFLVGHPVFERVGESEGRSALPSLAYGGAVPVSTQAARTSPAASGTAIATAVPARQVVAAPQTEATPAAAVRPPAAQDRSPVPAAADAMPFARIPINDLRLLPQATR